MFMFFVFLYGHRKCVSPVAVERSDALLFLFCSIRANFVDTSPQADLFTFILILIR